MKKRTTAITAAAAAALLLVGCSSSKPASNAATTTTASGATNGTTAGGGSVTIGVLTDLTGPAASGNKTFVNGVKAGVLLAKREGWTIKTVVGDTQTSPSSALAAAQKLVTQDHVAAVLVQSAIAFSAAPYLTSQSVPVIGDAEDATEWNTDKNMFSIGGAVYFNQVSTVYGKIFKQLGVTTTGTLGYGVSPSSADAALAASKSVQTDGLKAGYTNAQFPFGSTNVQPIALAMKSAGVNGFFASVDPNTGFSLITALRQAGIDLKAALLPDGYGADTLQAGPGALSAAQNVYFTLAYEPQSMDTPATKQLTSDLSSSGTTGVPTYGEYNGYVSVGLLLRALKGAGANPSHASLLTALGNVHDWDALGLWGGKTIDLANRTAQQSASLCTYVTKLVSTDFQVVPGLDPVCGTVVPGVTVGSS